MPVPNKPWWRVDADTDSSDKIVGLSSDAARWAWFRMGCHAKTQRRMGVFSGAAHLRFLIGSYGRHVPELMRAGLVHEWPTACERCAQDYAGDASDGFLVVHDYRRKQVDPTNAERQARFRERHGVANGDPNRGVTADRNGEETFISRALSPSMSKSTSKVTDEDEPYQVATPPEANDLRALAEELTQRPNVLANVWGGLGEMAVLQARKHGLAAVEREWRRIADQEQGFPTLRQLVLGSDNALNRVNGAPAAARPTEADRRQEIRDVAAKYNRMAEEAKRGAH